jgi:formamidopyrimidine-DNA glycosylase
MPELPEVETIRRGLEPLLTGKTIESVEEYYPQIFLRSDDVPEPPFTIGGLRRRGKYLLIDLDEGALLIVHLRMTGKLLLNRADTVPAPHTHLRFFLATKPKTALDYNDVRRFGRIILISGHDERACDPIRKLGPEPLSDDFTVEGLIQSARSRKSVSIKGLLLDQTVVAGIGNIYADESLFLAGIRPDRKSPDLSDEEIRRLHHAIQTVLEAAIGLGGTSFRDYVDGLGREGRFQWELSVYGRKDLPCKVCGRPLSHARIAGRTSHFCLSCQH